MEVIASHFCEVSALFFSFLQIRNASRPSSVALSLPNAMVKNLYDWSPRRAASPTSDHLGDDTHQLSVFDDGKMMPALPLHDLPRTFNVKFGVDGDYFGSHPLSYQ